MSTMPIQTMHHLIHHWLRRPSGRVAALLVLVMVCSVMLGVEIHSHAGGMDEHDHTSLSAYEDYLSRLAEHTPPSEFGNEAALHMHDISKPSTALATLPQLRTDDAVTATLNHTAVVIPPSTPRLPPYRPPIA